MNKPHIFNQYPQTTAPFMHLMFEQATELLPLKGLSIAHNVPLTQTTLLKIACLQASGAELTVTNPSFMQHDQTTLNWLEQHSIPFKSINSIQGEFDFLLDCGAELDENCTARKGIVELTRTGAIRYQQHSRNQVPIVSVDDSRLKCLETCLGTGEGVYRAITELSQYALSQKNILIFGYGKVGVGIAYYFSKISSSVIIVEPCIKKHDIINERGFTAIDGAIRSQVEQAALEADVIITATGLKNIISDNYNHQCFSNAILANAGAEDEFGYAFEPNQVLANKMPVNFSLVEPTLMAFLDPIFYAHNLACLDILQNSTHGFRPFNSQWDKDIVEQWARHHDWASSELDAIF
ncbi:MAG: hypothetical protein HWD86_09540 [Kangiellaceae bacterium]|nr:hypothetical protein [Kangiellaceae bacterium]